MFAFPWLIGMLRQVAEQVFAGIAYPAGNERAVDLAIATGTTKGTAAKLEQSLGLAFRESNLVIEARDQFGEVGGDPFADLLDQRRQVGRVKMDGCHAGRQFSS